MTRFRLGISDIAVHYYRYKRHTDNDLFCPLCGEAQENELHFVLCCPMLSDLREQFVPAKFINSQVCFDLVCIWHPVMKILCEICQFICKKKTLKIRSFKLLTQVIVLLDCQFSV